MGKICHAACAFIAAVAVSSCMSTGSLRVDTAPGWALGSKAMIAVGVIRNREGSRPTWMSCGVISIASYQVFLAERMVAEEVRPTAVVAAFSQT